MNAGIYTAVWLLVVGIWYLVVGIGFQSKLPTTENRQPITKHHQPIIIYFYLLIFYFSTKPQNHKTTRQQKIPTQKKEKASPGICIGLAIFVSQDKHQAVIRT